MTERPARRGRIKAAIAIGGVTAAVTLAAAAVSAAPPPSSPYTNAKPSPSTTIDPSEYNGFEPGPVEPKDRLQPGGQDGTKCSDHVHAVDDSYVVAAGGELHVNASNGLLANDADGHGSPLSISVWVSPGYGGDLDVDADDGSFIFRPDPGFSGPVEFSYSAYDGAFDDCRGDNTASVTISVIEFRKVSPSSPGGHPFQPWWL